MNIRKILAEKTAEYEETLTEEAIYESPEMREFLESLAETVLGKKIRIVVFADEKATSWTDGKTIWINYRASYVRKGATREARFICFLGAFFHECAHIRYMDFREQRYAMSRYQSGTLYGAAPARTKENEAWYDEFMESFTSEKWKEIYRMLTKKLLNLLVDGHDEKTMARESGGMVEDCITRFSEEMRMNQRSLSDIKEKVGSGEWTNLQASFALLLTYIRDENILYSEEEELDCDLYRLVERTSGTMLRNNSGDITSYEALNRLLLETYPVIRDALSEPEGNGNNQSQKTDPKVGEGERDNTGSSKAEEEASGEANGESENTSSSTASDPSDEKLREILSQLGEIFDESQGTEGSDAGAKTGDSREESDAGKTAASILKRMEGEIAEEKAARELDDARTKELQEEAGMTLSQSSSHRDIMVNVIKQTTFPPEARQRYEEELAQVEKVSSQLKKKILSIMKQNKLGGERRRLYFGKEIDARDLFRPQGDFFKNRTSLKDEADMALAVLIDHSGSMAGTKLEVCERAAVLLHDFAAGLRIPCHIAGHNVTSSKSINYYVYTDFDSFSPKADRYRLAQMKDSGCNRDGAAIEIICKRLSQRPEKIKLLLVLCDGKPNDTDYKGEKAEEDIRSILRKYRSRIETIGCAIDEDRDVIERIYGDSFLSIDDLESLPITLTSLVRKRLLRSL